MDSWYGASATAYAIEWTGNVGLVLTAKRVSVSLLAIGVVGCYVVCSAYYARVRLYVTLAKYRDSDGIGCDK